MERRPAASFLIELAVVAAVMLNSCAAVGGTTDPSDGTDLRAFALLLMVLFLLLSFSFSSCCCLA